MELLAAVGSVCILLGAIVIGTWMESEHNAKVCIEGTPIVLKAKVYKCVEQK